jgi:hypothetical protein
MSDTLHYVLNSGLWSCLWLLIGYALGRLERQAQRNSLSRKDSHGHP